MLILSASILQTLMREISHDGGLLHLGSSVLKDLKRTSVVLAKLRM